MNDLRNGVVRETHSVSFLMDFPLASISPRNMTSWGWSRVVTCQLFFRFKSKINCLMRLDQMVSFREVSRTWGSEINKTWVGLSVD